MAWIRSEVSEMRLVTMARKRRLEALSDIGEFCEVIFLHRKSRVACEIFLDWFKKHRHGVSRSQLSQFLRDLEDGKMREGFRYRRQSFYRTVLRRLVDLGFIRLITRSDHVSYYIEVTQRIPKKAPGGRNFYNRAFYICKIWNDFFKR